MNSQGKFRLWLVVLLAVLVLGGVGMFVLYRFYPREEVVGQVEVNGGGNEQVVVNTNGGNVEGVGNVNQPVVNTNEVVNGGSGVSDDNRTLALARSFTERYGSFSNQNEYENLTSLFLYMTPKLKKQTEDFIQAQGEQNTDTYLGLTTDVVSVLVDKQEEEKVVVLVSTRRRESKEGEATKVFSQTARVVLVKEGGEWLVDKFEWQ